MIIHKFTCPECNSSNLVKNGKNAQGKQKYFCKDCGRYGVINPSVKYSEQRKEEILRAYEERSSMRGIERTFGVDRHTLSKWLKKKPKICQN